MLLIIDANNLAYRARYAYNLSYKGKDTSVTYGVMRMLMSLMKKFKPDACMMAWDGGTPGFRKRLVPSYKATRKGREDDPTWPEFLSQLQELENILPCTGVLQVRRIGIEADDLMAQAARMSLSESIIVTTDGDLLQCITAYTSVYSPSRDVLYTHDNFEELIGYPVHQHIICKALQGDSSDNIAGAVGVGPKTALKILNGNENRIPKSTQERLKAFRESGNYEAAYTAMDLNYDVVGARYVLLNAKWQGYDKRLYQWCMKCGFVSLIEAGSFGVIFGGLRQPLFDDKLRMPRVWDYNRCPV